MPEGPECAVVVDELQGACGQIFLAAEVIENEPGKEHRFSKKPIKDWDKLQQPWFIDSIRAKGKLIIFDIVILNSGERWVGLSTLGMSGDWRFDSGGHKHCRLSFIHDRGDLSFIDTRCFGTFRLLTPKEAEKAIEKIGWDLLQAPMSAAEWTKLQQHPKISNKQIGEALLEQSLFAGIGNIYKAETIWELKLNPETLVKDLTENEWAEINTVAHKILQKAYKLGGSSIVDFTANGKEGKAQEVLNVYGKEKCPEGHSISKLTQKGGSTERTTWWCKTCYEQNSKKLTRKPDDAVSLITAQLPGIEPHFNTDYTRRIKAT